MKPLLFGLLMLASTGGSHCAEEEVKPKLSARAVDCLQSIERTIKSASTFEGESRLEWLKAVHSQIHVFHEWMDSHRHEVFPTRTHSQNDAVTRFIRGIVEVRHQMVDAFGVTKALSDEELKVISQRIEELIRQAKGF